MASFKADKPAVGTQHGVQPKKGPAKPSGTTPKAPASKPAAPKKTEQKPKEPKKKLAAGDKPACCSK